MIIPSDTQTPTPSFPHVCIGAVTAPIIARLEAKYEDLDSQAQAFVNAGPSRARRTLRIAQLIFAQAIGERYGIAPEGIGLASKASGAPRLIVADKDEPILHISVSHSEHALAVACSPFPIGIDIEEKRTLPTRPITLLFSAKEQTSITDDDSFTCAWVRKEAYAKWQGTGLNDSLADGIYDTPTHIIRYHLGRQILYMGLAGTRCHDACIVEWEL